MSFAGYIEAEFVVPSGIAFKVVTNTSTPGNVTVTVTPGSYFPSTFAAALQSDLNTQAPITAGAWSVSWSTTTGKYTIAVDADTFSANNIDASLWPLLGLTGDAIADTASKVCDYQALGVWRPDCVLLAAIESRRAPKYSDHRNTVSPTGEVLGLVSQRMFRHQDLVYSHVPRHRTWEASAIAAGDTNASYERFLSDTQLGDGHAWFKVSARVKIVDHNSVAVGADKSVTAWQITRLPGLDALRMSEGITNGLFYRVEWPEIVAVI